MVQNLSPARDYVALDNPSASLRPNAASERSLIVNRPKPGNLTTVKAINPVGATEPYWGTLRPFLLKTAGECPILPPEYSENPASDFYKDAMVVVDSSKAFDDERHKIVLYWADNPGQS